MAGAPAAPPGPLGGGIRGRTGHRSTRLRPRPQPRPRPRPGRHRSVGERAGHRHPGQRAPGARGLRPPRGVRAQASEWVQGHPHAARLSRSPWALATRPGSRAGPARGALAGRVPGESIYTVRHPGPTDAVPCCVGPDQPSTSLGVMIDTAAVSVRDLHDPPVPPGRPRSRIRVHHARGRGRVPGTGPAVLWRQGLHRDAAPGREGLPARALPVPADARGHRPQLSRGHRLPGPARGGAG